MPKGALKHSPTLVPRGSWSAPHYPCASVDHFGITYPIRLALIFVIIMAVFAILSAIKLSICWEF